MTKAELNAHWTLPDETLGDSYTITHKREREAFVKGWHKAVELCYEWLYQRQTVDLEVSDIDKFIEDFKNYMEEQK